jgi:hypothetical protein
LPDCKAHAAQPPIRPPLPVQKQEDDDMEQKDWNIEQRPAMTSGQIKQVQELAQTIRYGSITLVFQDGILVQIDKNEKIRLPKE